VGLMDKEFVEKVWTSADGDGVGKTADGGDVEDNYTIEGLY